MRRPPSAIMALACMASLSLPEQAQSVRAHLPTSKPRPIVRRMVGGTYAEINAWNEAVELRRAIKKGVTP